MAPQLSATVARARELAQKRRQQLSTAHVLVALFQEDTQVAGLCARLGLSEEALLSCLGQGYDEHASGIDLAVERARKLAQAAGAAHALPLHLLFSLVRDPRSAANVGLVRAGVQPDLLTTAAWDVLFKRSENSMAPPVEQQPEPRQHVAERGPRVRVRHHGRLRSLLLSEQTESKLQRTKSGSKGADVVAAGAIHHADPGPHPEAGLDLSIETETKLLRGKARAEGHPWHARTHKALAPARARAPRVRAKSPVPQASPVAAYALDAQRFPLLTSLGRNLTLLAASGEIDPVIGRDRDIDQLLDVLARRRGNNPLLVGAPGVGKTAIVEGLALALVDPQAVTAGLEQRILLEISASSLLAGTGVRGALSERVQALRKEVAAAAGRVLLFIDEIHTVLAGGEGEGLGNELKTALARGELPVIGATTDAEYRRVFERDAALSRRFTRIEVSEPSRSDTLAILQALAPKYAVHHGVRYEPSALTAAVELSVRYLPLRQLPDKAIALLDQAAARARRRHEPEVDDAAVAQVVSELARVPVDRLLMNDREALLCLEQQLAARVLGQARAVASIGSALRKSAAGFRGKRPLGTFLFMGPTGVGKTEMAKAISEVLFPGIPLTRIDMSELGQPHAVARLLGAPPGYIGHDDGGQLTEAVRHRPYQLVLLDEIEKAHLDVLLALLPLLDEGRLTDGRGRTVDFTNTVIVMTSNLGVEGSLARGRIGFGEASDMASANQEAHALGLVRSALPPELFNRIDEPLYFFPLSEHDVAEIARRMVAAVAEVVQAEHGVRVEVHASAITALLGSGGFDRQLGARPMRRTVGRLVEAPLARALLAREFVAGDVVSLGADGLEIKLVRLGASEPAVSAQ
jgi:ATP-dependent Clp protease ATP-binding subunit ClpC